MDVAVEGFLFHREKNIYYGRKKQELFLIRKKLGIDCYQPQFDGRG